MKWSGVGTACPKSAWASSVANSVGAVSIRSRETSLNRFARVAAYENWLAKAEERALAEAVCLDDRLPTPAPQTLDDLLPFTAPDVN